MGEVRTYYLVDGKEEFMQLAEIEHARVYHSPKRISLFQL